MSTETVEDPAWTMRAPQPGSPATLPGGTHLISCDLAIAAAVARLEHLTYLLRHSPKDGHTVDHLFKLTGVYWSEAASHYEAFRQVNSCEGKA
jgi:hypothetical protein